MIEPYSELRRLYPLDALLPQHLNLVVSELKFTPHVKGDALFSSGQLDEDTMYLLQGDVEGTYIDGRRKKVSAGALASRYALGDLQPRPFTAMIASGHACVARINRRLLEKIIIWDQVARAHGKQPSENNVDTEQWLLELFSTPAIRRIPAANTERLFAGLKEINMSAGQTVVREGELGEYFYIIKSGRCEVSRFHGQGESGFLATLNAGDTFGADALIANVPRNATVKMSTVGTLLRLSKTDFSHLLKLPVVPWIGSVEAKKMAAEGAQLLDVRTEPEFRKQTIKGAINIPLAVIRERLESLEMRKPYVAFCENGERSASAVYVLKQKGYEVFALQGGLQAIGG